MAVHAIFLISPPLALTDMFNYINYGRMEVLHNLNPYTTIPVLEPHSDPSYALSNWHQLLSPYGPLFTLLTFAVVPLGVAGSFWALKGILVAASLAIDPAGLEVRAAAGSRADGGDRAGRAEPDRARVGPRRRPQRLPDDPLHHGRPSTCCCCSRTFEQPVEALPRLAQLPDAARRWLLPLSGAQVGAGSAFVLAAAIKASGAVLIPVVLAALLRTPRALVQVLVGMLLAAAAVAFSSLLAFGLHIPDLSTQGSLVTGESVPNLIGLAIGAGGESDTLRRLLVAVLLASILGCCWLAFKRRDAITAAGWASVALLVTLSWVLPWYVLWVLPMAALSRSVRLRRVSLVLGVYLIIAWAPVSGLLWNAIGFHPERTALGRLHQRAVRELLN